MDPVRVVGSFWSAEEALEVAAELRPEVLRAIALIHRMHHREFVGIRENWTIHSAHFPVFPTADPLEPWYLVVESMTLQIVGLLGPLFLLGAYALLSSGRMVATSPMYQVLNLMGAGVMVWVGVSTNVWSVWVLNGIWCLIALLGLIRIRRRNNEEPV